MALYRGFREFKTEDKDLAADLRRQNQALEEGFANAERDLAVRLKTVRVTDATGQAQHGEHVLAGFNQSATILLPLSAPETEGRTLKITRVANTITIVAQGGQLVDGAESVTHSTTGAREFTDDGQGGFWGSV